MIRVSQPGFPEISIIIPARDEEGNVGPLTREIESSFEGVRWEALWVDDGSRDGTFREIEARALENAGVRGITLGNPLGKSAALARGIRESRAPVLGFLDGDLQNPPGELRMVFEVLGNRPELAMIQGRRRDRKDGVSRLAAAAVGRYFRRAVLGDSFEDIGCGLRVMRREVARELPLHYEGMHRFLPILVRMLGRQVEEIDVIHRPRNAGHSKYGIGPVKRGLCGLADLFAIRWMQWRFRNLGDSA